MSQYNILKQRNIIILNLCLTNFNKNVVASLNESKFKSLK